MLGLPNIDSRISHKLPLIRVRAFNSLFVFAVGKQISGIVHPVRIWHRETPVNITADLRNSGFIKSVWTSAEVVRSGYRARNILFRRFSVIGSEFLTHLR